MICSKIMMITTSPTTVAASEIIPLTTIARRTGNYINSGSNSVILSRPGYFKVSGTITFTSATTGNATIKLQKNGVDVHGIVSSGTISTASDEAITLPIDGLIRVFPTDGIAMLTLVTEGINIDISNVALTVKAEY